MRLEEILNLINKKSKTKIEIVKYNEGVIVNEGIFDSLDILMEFIRENHPIKSYLNCEVIYIDTSVEEEIDYDYDEEPYVYDSYSVLKIAVKN